MSATTLRFVSNEGHYSIYLDAEGDEVYLAEGSTTRLVLSIDELDLHDLWDNYRNEQYRKSGYAVTWKFLDIVRDMLVDPDEVDEWQGCESCNYPTHSDDQVSVNRGSDTVCPDCCDNEYFYCEHCEEYAHNDDATSTLEDDVVCDRCRSGYFTWCEDCEGYYRDENSYEHQHDTGCDCEAPLQSFSVPNNGDGLLRNDTRVTVSLAAGVISAEGMDEISNLIRNEAYTMERSLPLGPDGFRDYDHEDYARSQKMSTLAYKVGLIGEEWQNRDGNFTKRLGKFAHKTFDGLKLDPALISKVGNIARAHSTPVNYEVEVTRDLNLPPEEFAHEDSCWWQSYSEGRCALKNNGGFGLRTFSPHGEDSWGRTSVTGRAWVMPLRMTEDGDLTPTCNTETPDAYVVFNGYGTLSGYTPARMLSHMAGMTYRKVEFGCDPMFINAGSGYLVAPEEIANPYTDGRLYLSVSDHADLARTERMMANA